MIRKKPLTGLDPVMDAGFPKRSCSNENLDHVPIQFDRIMVWVPAVGHKQRGRAKAASHPIGIVTKAGQQGRQKHRP